MLCKVSTAINYYIRLPYVGSYIPSAIASGWLLTPASGVAPSRLALLCGNRFGAPRLIYSPMLLCITCELVPRYLVYDTGTVDVAMP